MIRNGGDQSGVVVTKLEGRGPLNLMGLETFLALQTELERLEQDIDVRVVILTGSGDRAFSAGVDLNEMKDLDSAAAEIFIKALHAPARKLLTMAVPAIAAVRGPCLGGALELALACDIRLAAEDAVLGLPEVRVGIPSVIEASLLPPTIGLGRARRLLLTGETVDAQEALAIGLVDRVVPAGSLLQIAQETAEDLAGMSREVLASQKEIVAKWLEVGEEESARFTIQEFARIFNTGIPHEGMTAFLEKRAPEFRGH
ncbi:MAG: enoyl-CoA hydratase-related protein [Chloroflexi bacterium]|nr:enoyl-CoA hydratase-related protein [Chloroflexota bacterium]MDA1270632.1 enoyl-CoA hydratase-related protein [Chloroflexota bacterium]